MSRAESLLRPMPPTVADLHNDFMEGTGFLMAVPVPDQGPAAAGSSPGVRKPSRPIRVLVIDDDSRVRAALRQTIALEADLVVIADAADATAALTLAEGADPSVALVDMLLPDAATGLDLVRSLARRRGCAVVAMSVRGGLRPAALAAGAVAFAEKGTDIDALLNMIRSAAQ